MEHKPVFSVVVLTYNQAELIEETLESIYNQTYPNIELIISDDASTDNTVEVIDEWLKQRKHRFVEVIINVNRENQGISGNHSKGLKLATGEFVKYIGGDDLLLPNALEKMAEFLLNNKNAKFCVSKIKAFIVIKKKKIIIAEMPDKLSLKRLQQASDAKVQFRSLAVKDQIPAPGTFLEKMFLRNMAIQMRATKRLKIGING